MVQRPLVEPPRRIQHTERPVRQLGVLCPSQLVPVLLSSRVSETLPPASMCEMQEWVTSYLAATIFSTSAGRIVPPGRHCHREHCSVNYCYYQKLIYKWIVVQAVFSNIFNHKVIILLNCYIVFIFVID